MGRLEDRVAVVTGASRGIGRAIAHAFATEGATVAGLYAPSEPYPAEALGDLERVGRPGLMLACDVSAEDQVSTAMDEIVRRLGRVDLLVANAGHANIAPVTDLTVEQWDQMMAVHLRGTFLCCRAVLPGMIARGDGVIITVASQIAYIGAEGLAHYVAAKAGIVGLTRSLAREVARHGVRVNGIAPGPIQTGILPPDPAFDSELAARLPIGRLGTPDDVAPTAVFLASDDSRFYIGQFLSPNGGEVMF